MAEVNFTVADTDVDPHSGITCSQAEFDQMRALIIEMTQTVMDKAAANPDSQPNPETLAGLPSDDYETPHDGEAESRHSAAE